MEKNKEEPFTSYRWHEDVGAKAVGYEESTEEEKEESKKQFDKILKDRDIK